MKRFTQEGIDQIVDISDSLEMQAERLTQMLRETTEGADTYCIIAACLRSLDHAVAQLQEAR